MPRQRIADQFKADLCRLPGVLAVEARSARSFGRHTHDQFGIGMLLSGAQDSASGRGQVRAVPGAMITVNPNEVHDGRAIAEEPRAWRMLYFEPGVIARFAAEMGCNPGSEFKYPVLEQRSIAQAFLCLHATLTGCKDDSWQDMVEQTLFRILEPLLDSPTPAAWRRLPADAIANAQTRIDAAPETPVTLAELSAEAGLSRYHFLRAFKTITGMPPHAYRLQRQLQMARRLILSGHTLAEVALNAGFADQSHLTRRFTNIYGLTPGALASAVRYGQRQ